MNSITNMTLNLFLFQGIALVILSVLWTCNRYRNHQPLERIRLFQWSLIAIGFVGLLLLLPLGPRWTFHIPVAKIPEQHQLVNNGNQNLPDAVIKPLQTPEFVESASQLAQPHLVSEPTPVHAPQISVASTADVKPFQQSDIETVNQSIMPVVKTENQVVEPPANKGYAHYFSFVLIGFCVPPVYLFLGACIAKFKLNRTVSRSIAAEEDVQELFERIVGVSYQKIDLRVSSEIETPMIFGLWKTVLLIPEKILASPEEIRAALAHEFSHFRRGDL